MHCLIAGATGLIGQRLMNELITDMSVDFVTAVSRRPLQLTHDKLEVVQVPSFEKMNTVKLPEADIGFCCLGTTIKNAGTREAFFRIDHGYTMNFAKACLAANVKVFVVVSAHGANSNSKVFYSHVKGRIEDDLKKLDFERLVIVRPSLLLGQRRESRPAEKAAQFFGHFFRPLMVGGLAEFRPVEASRVAKKMKFVATAANIEKVEIVPNRDI